MFCTIPTAKFTFKVAETTTLLHSLNAAAGSQSLPAAAARRRERSTFAGNVFSRHAAPRGLDGFASSMCIPVGRPDSTCYRFGFSHSFLKAPPCHTCKNAHRPTVKNKQTPIKTSSAASASVSRLCRGRRGVCAQSAKGCRQAQTETKKAVKKFTTV